LLKDSICIDIFGLTREGCYGTNDQKDEKTPYKWGDMPGIDEYEKETGIIHDRNEYMSNREFMQYVGSDIFRKIYPKVWADATIRMINKESSEVGIVYDTRFIEEVEAIHAEGGKVIRLTRNPYPDDIHSSETALDNYEGFDVVIDNANLTISETNEVVRQWLATQGILPNNDVIVREGE
jgi:hypothetical protein